MTFATIKSSGRGTVRYRLMIEGAPEEWVTDKSITHATNKAGRTVRPGLLHEGLAIHDRCLMAEGKINADGITFRVTPTDGHDYPTAAFSRYPEPIAVLDTALTPTGTTIDSNRTLADDSYYYIGSETIKTATYPTIARHQWDSATQAHSIAFNELERVVYIYEYPPTFEGRRALLYAYGKGDDVAGDGTCIWRGVINRPPRLDRNGVTWMLEAQSVVSLLRQRLAGALQVAKPVLLNHTVACSFFLQLGYNGVGGEVYYLNGPGTEESIIAGVNIKFAAAVSALSIGEIDHIKLEKSSDTSWRIRVHTNAEVPSFVLQCGSPLLGTVRTPDAPWTDSDGGNRPGVGIPGAGATFDDVYLLQGGKDYYVDLTFDNPLFVRDPGLYTYDPTTAPLGDASTIMTSNTKAGNPLVNLFVNGTLTDPIYGAWRIYVDTDLSDAIDMTAYITGSYKPDGLFKIIDAGQEGSLWWIELEPWQGPGPLPGTPIGGVEIAQAWAAQNGFAGFLNSATEITVIRDYGFGSVAEFVVTIKDQAVNANDGDTPQITDADLTTWAVGAELASSDQFFRFYRFGKALDLETVLAEEVKFICHMMRIAADGRIDLVPLPNHSDAFITDDAHTIDLSGIITPAGTYGSWPGWEPQRDGLINALTIKDSYSPEKDDWLTEQKFQDPDSIATHKGRGKVEATIAPYSAPGYPGGVFGDQTKLAFESIAQQFLGVFANDYAVITIDVPFKHFDVLCGDVVQLTHRLIPAGDGTRGMTSRNGVCIERRWNLDPKEERAGTLTFMVWLRPRFGYSPAGYVTSKSNTSGDIWVLTFDVGSGFNRYWSTNDDGLVSQHFAVGDFIRVVQFNDSSPTEVTGTVTATGLHTVTVSLDGTWTPGASNWVLKAQVDDSDGARSTTNQRRFAYNANSQQYLPYSFARKFS